MIGGDMQGLMPETVIYGVKQGETLESLLDMRLTHTITEQDTKNAVKQAIKLGYTKVRVANYTFNGETDKPDFAKAVNV